MAKKHIDPLSYLDLVKATTEPRFDHPGRKSIVFGVPQSDLPNCYQRIEDESGVRYLAKRYGEFIPNPPGCVGIRKLPKGMEILDVSKEANDELLATSQD